MCACSATGRRTRLAKLGPTASLTTRFPPRAYARLLAAGPYDEQTRAHVLTCVLPPQGKKHCYTDVGVCSDGKKSAQVAGAEWSFLACAPSKGTLNTTKVPSKYNQHHWERMDGGGVCNSTGGTGNGAACVFPFTYKGQSFSDCTRTDNAGSLWCATTANYGKDKKWGNCPAKGCPTASGSSKPQTLAPGCQNITSPNNRKYHMRNMPLGASKAVTFSVQAGNDAHLGFFSDKKATTEVYEIVISGWGNTQSAIRQKSQGKNQVTKSTRGLLSRNKMVDFWADAVDGLVRLGKGKLVGQNVLMQWQDPNPHVASYVGVMTGWGASGRWSICTGCGQYNTPNTGKYKITNVTLGASKAVTFSVIASNDAHIGFFSDKKALNEVYEIVISGWGNTQSVIRQRNQGRNQVTKSTRGLLSKTQKKFFWADAVKGLVRLGTGSTVGEHILMEWQDPSPHIASYVGVMTGWGSTGRCAKLQFKMHQIRT